MNAEECVQKGLLAKDRPDAGRAKSSVEMARHKLALGKREIDAGIFENALVSAYTSMFHSARALLYRDGYKERSHFAVWVYVNEKYSGKIERKFLNELNSLRLQRHDLMYGIEEIDETGRKEAEEALKIAEGFLQAVEKIIDGGKSE